MDSSSWIWDDLNNLTNYSNITYNLDINSYSSNCEQITNHWMFLIFSGYILPFISPRVRNYLKETINSIKKSNKGGQFVTLTEFGFEKIQEIENNSEMKEFIKRMCYEKKIEWNDENLEKIAWLFSGDSDETHESITQTWTKLNKVLEELNLKEKDKESLRP